MCQAEEDIDCRAIFESIERDTAELLKADQSERLKQNMIEAINERIDKMHKDIDARGEEFIQNVLDNFLKKDEKEDEKDDKKKKKGKSTSQKKEEALRQNRLDEINSLTSIIEKNFQTKMFELINSVDDIMKISSIVEGSSQLFSESKLNELLIVGKDNFGIKGNRKLAAMLKGGKSLIDLTWDASKNNVSYSTVNKDDPTILKVHGTTCYTYYQTSQSFKDEDFCVEVEYNISTNDNYFYLGIINENVSTTGNCMCCTISGGFYIQPAGDVVLNGSRQTNTKLSAAKSKDHVVVFRVLTSEKKMYITMDENDEQGPFTIVGNTFRFVSGSCNTCTGQVKISRASYE